MMKKITLKFTLIFTILLTSFSGHAQEGFVGEVRMFAGNFAPRNWAYCQGQLLAISTNTALFSILGTTYGGDGITTFALPDLRSRVAVGTGTGPGLSTRTLGQKIGNEYTYLNTTPTHNHNYVTSYSTDAAVRTIPEVGDVPAKANFGPGLSTTDVKIYGPATNVVDNTKTTSTIGGQQHIDLTQPSTVINYIICLYGVFPSRN